MMVTGSHIPFDRNGYKANSAKGELLKTDEGPIQEKVAAVRAQLYAQPLATSLFAENGLFKSGPRELRAPSEAGRRSYLRRYLDFFDPLEGLRLLVYQHSAVGRDLLVELLEGLGATPIPAGRSETFVPIDTENIGADLLDAIQRMVTEARAHGPIDAVVSTDGDSDRPLVLGVNPRDGQVQFFGGDLVGMVVAEYLAPDAVVVPISCNDAVDRGPLRHLLEPKTRIGSPYVIAGMQQAALKGRRRICGWEANGGFLTGSDWELGGNRLTALPTRDALLPILAVLAAAQRANRPLIEMFARLPPRFSQAALLREVPRQRSVEAMQRFSPEDLRCLEVSYAEGSPRCYDAHGEPLAGQPTGLEDLRHELEALFNPSSGFAPVAHLSYVDGIRVRFANGDVAHVRASGNADELRIYSVADRPERAEEIVRLGIAEPDGILRRLLALKAAG